MSIGASIAGYFSKSKTVNEPDATTKALNEFRLKQAQSLVQDYGAALKNLTGLGTPSATTLGYADETARLASQPGLNANDWYNQAIASSTSAYDKNIDYILQSLAPQLVDAGNSYYNQILKPEISNNNALLGLARSGANQEAQAKGAASIALPISQQISGLVGQNLQSRAGAIQGFAQQRPEVDTNLRNAELQRRGIGIEASDYSRQQQQKNQETYANLLTSFINGTPYQGGGESRTTAWGVSAQVSGSSGAGGGGGSGGYGGSDINMKENLEHFDSKAFLDQLAAYQYNYKGEDIPTAGVLAQDLEKTEVGKALVMDTEQGKVVNAVQLAFVLAACLVDMNERLSKLNV